jgi:serine phosphatase RsbU (regulator of sigma subunit)
LGGLAFSDGIPEAVNEQGEEFGDERLLAALGRLADGSAARFCEGIVEAVRDYAGSHPQADDITLIAVKVL